MLWLSPYRFSAICRLRQILSDLPNLTQAVILLLKQHQEFQKQDAGSLGQVGGYPGHSSDTGNCTEPPAALSSALRLPSLPFSKHKELGGPHMSHPTALSKEQAELNLPRKVSHQEAGSFTPGTMDQEEPGVEVLRAPPLVATEHSVSFGALS